MIIRDIKQIPKLADIAAFDTETTSLNPRTGQIIGFSVSDYKASFYIVHKEWVNGELVEVVPFEDCQKYLKSLLNKKLFMFNAYFDVTYTKNYFGVDLVDAIYADVQLMNHTHDENLGGGLKFLAQIFLGANSADEQVELKAHLKAIGAGPHEFYKANTAIIGKYAAQDAKLTYRLGQLFERRFAPLPKLKELFYSEIMPLQREVVIPMMQRGVVVDVPKMQKALEEITIDIESFKTELMAEIAPVTESFYAWYYDKNYPLKSRGLVYSKMKEGLSLREAQKAVAADKGDEGFNIQSKLHLGDLFFKIFKMEPLSTTDKGAPQVNEEFLEHAAETLPWVKNLIIFNKLMKIKSTYYERVLQEQEDGIFYPDYFLHRTVSGRMSGDMQQLPRPLESGHPLLMKYNNQIREFFVARPGHILIDNDYDSLEPRIFSAVAGDEALTNIFKNGADFYSTIAIMVEGLQGVSADKKAANYLGKVNKPARQTAKSYSLGVAYGLDDYKLHKDLNISQMEAKRLIAGYFAAFPKLSSWMQATREHILAKGAIETRFGRIRRHPKIPSIYERHGNAILNALDLWKKYNEAPAIYKAAKQDYKTLRHALNNSYNVQIQGLAAHVLNRAAIAMALEFKQKNIPAHIIGAIHDELIIECPVSIYIQVAEIVKRTMETTTIIETPLVAEPSAGYDLVSAKDDKNKIGGLSGVSSC